jgi:hypothetical protein
MRRWMFMAAVSVALLVAPLWAQRGGRGGMGGGFHGGFAGRGGGFVGTPRAGYWGGGFHGGFVHGRYPGRWPYYPGRFPFWGWRYPWWGFRGWYGYGSWGYPWWGGYGGVSVGYFPSGWSSDPTTQYPVYVNANPDTGGSAVAYQQQQDIDRLSDEVARLRAEQQSGATRGPAPPPPKTEIRAETLLVFRDKHTEEIENYAIVGKTLWIFTEQRARKIPIVELNVLATTKANEARGIDFRLPVQ